MTYNKMFKVFWWVGTVALWIASFVHGAMYNAIEYVND